MRDHVTRRPMPVDQAILWKPLHDSHYVVASLQPGDGGRLRIFVRQQALARAQAVARAGHGRAFGLLYGHTYHCDVTGAHYLVIETVGEQHALTEDELADGIGRVLAEPLEGKGTQVIGWYRSVAHVESRPTGITAAIHTRQFGQPWQTALVLSESSNAPGGAFFLNDTANSRWFCTPFYELPDHAPAPGAAKPTCIEWAQYITADNVIYDTREVAHVSESRAADRQGPRRWRPRSDRSPSVDPGIQAAPAADLTDSRWSPLSGGPGVDMQPATDDAPPDNEASSDEPPKVVEKVVRREPENRLADVQPKAARPKRETAKRRVAGFLDRPVGKLTTVDDLDQRRASRGTLRVVSDEDDTMVDDQPGRYIDLARAEGFFVAAKYDTRDESGEPQTLWVLNEPYSGFLLTVAAARDEVLDATLHYNLHTDDAGLHRTPFPQHRDPDSATIYMRETCVESLRAKCQRLRATNKLVREWKVSPTITFMTPGEWESIGTSTEDGAGNAIRTLNNVRIGELPEGVRNQFGLTVPDDLSA